MNIVSVVLEPVAAYQLKLYYQNYLESGTVTVTSEDSSFPKYRLHDRAQGLLFKGVSHPDPFNISLDFGATGPYPAIDTGIIGKNHNLTGLNLGIYYSDNGVDWTLAKEWTGISGMNRQSFTQHSARYWVLRIDAPTANPEIGEFFLTKVLSFERNPNWGYGHGDRKNVNRLESLSGYSQKTKWGEKRKRRSYHLTKMDDAQRVDLETFEGAIDGIKNFYIEDLLGNLFFAELPDGLPDFEAESMNRWGIDFDVFEVLD